MRPEPQPGWSLDDWLAYQERLHPQAIELGLARLRRVAERLGLLQQPPLTLTVGGTNGKGSTTTLLALCCREAGYRVGAYTSPHLFHYTERIAIDGVPIAEPELCAAFHRIEQARAGESLTYFEFGTLAALLVFRHAGVAVQVLEVGLGGRLDAVNLLDADAAIVTQIGLDHEDWLGKGRDAIGREKAGIYRSGKPAILADRDPPQGVLTAAAEAGVPLTRFDRGDYACQRTGDHWLWTTASVSSPPLPMPALSGAHQLDNAAAAVTALQALSARLPVPWPAIQRALTQLNLQGRLQRRGRFVLDVAHNAEAAQALARWLAQEFPGQPALWLAGVLSDKPVEAMAAALRAVVSQAVTCDLPSPRALSGAALAARLTAAGLAASAGGASEAALALALRQAAPDQPILICGSFLTVAALAPLISI